MRTVSPHGGGFARPARATATLRDYPLVFGYRGGAGAASLSFGGGDRGKTSPTNNINNNKGKNKKNSDETAVVAAKENPVLLITYGILVFQTTVWTIFPILFPSEETDLSWTANPDAMVTIQNMGALGFCLTLLGWAGIWAFTARQKRLFCTSWLLSNTLQLVLYFLNVNNGAAVENGNAMPEAMKIDLPLAITLSLFPMIGVLWPDPS